MNISNEDSERLFFEVLERVIRFWSHVNSSCAQAARPNRRRTAQETIAHSLRNRLAQLLENLVKVYLSEGNHGDMINILKKGLQNLAELHIGPLSAVPRPYEPIELVSYIRQALNSYPDSDNRTFSPPHVFATEVLGDQAHSRFDQAPINNYSDYGELTNLIKNSQTTSGTSLEKELQDYFSDTSPWLRNRDENFTLNANDDKAIGFISLPRIDLSNPLRWPSLMHEVGHFEDNANPETLYESFLSLENGAIADEANKSMQAFLVTLDRGSNSANVEIKKWLMECWCDSHAACVAGAPAFFSQMHAFLFSSPCYLTEPALDKGYPPAWFRLRLMRALISTRHSENTPSNKIINEAIHLEWSVMEKLFQPSSNADIRNNHNLKNLFNYFLCFLRHQFPKRKWLNQTDISSDTLNELIQDLSEGLPIPTHRCFEGNNQKRATHAEILLAGWHTRNKTSKDSLLEIVKKTNFQLQESLPKLLAVVDRADASLQMSIQVSEWFNILNKPQENTSDSVAASLTRSTLTPSISTGLLTDNEIVDLLKSNSLRVIPLLGGISSIVGTVVDIRLGHNFEIFFTNISGAMDALDHGRRNSVDSMEVDYDSLEGLEISPGQFVLGHTLEYLKLPKDVAAEINGRSSFARLGIEVHMTAPFVEAGFDGCLTLEISNSGHSTVKLYPGMRIAQLRFYKCASQPRVPYGERDEVKYRGRLRHNKTEQFTDWEIDAFNTESYRRKPKKNGAA